MGDRTRKPWSDYMLDGFRIRATCQACYDLGHTHPNPACPDCAARVARYRAGEVCCPRCGPFLWTNKPSPAG